MWMSKKAEYAFRAMLTLGRASPAARALRTGEIARREEIPHKFLEAILVDLRKAGLVRSQRGAEGGHLLAKDPSLIKVGEIWRAIDGPGAGAGEPPPPDAVASPYQFVWEEVARVTAEVIDGVSLQDVMRRAEEQQQSAIQFNI